MALRASVGALRFIGRIPIVKTQPQRYIITGVSRDSSGAALGFCAVELFETVSGAIRGSTVSDANGNFTLDTTQPPLTFFLVAYLAGSPDVAGTTVNTITSVPG